MIQVKLFDGHHMDKLKTAISDLGGLPEYSLSDMQLRCMIGQCYYLIDDCTRDIYAVVSSERIFTDSDQWDQNAIITQAWDYQITLCLYDEYALEEHKFTTDELSLMIAQICKDKNDRTTYFNLDILSGDMSDILRSALEDNSFVVSSNGDYVRQWWKIIQDGTLQANRE